jgi:hypothetical protein
LQICATLTRYDADLCEPGDRDRGGKAPGIISQYFVELARAETWAETILTHSSVRAKPLYRSVCLHCPNLPTFDGRFWDTPHVLAFCGVSNPFPRAVPMLTASNGRRLA